MQEAYQVLSNPQERAYYDDNRDELLESEDEEVDAREYHEVEAADLDLYKWCSREAFVDFSSGASPHPAHAKVLARGAFTALPRRHLHLAQRRTASSQSTTTYFKSCTSMKGRRRVGIYSGLASAAREQTKGG